MGKMHKFHWGRWLLDGLVILVTGMWDVSSIYCIDRIVLMVKATSLSWGSRFYVAASQ